MAADFPIVNGKEYDFSSIETSAPLVGIFRKITEISYSDSLTPGEFRTNVPWIEATTRGEYSAEGSITMSRQFHPLFMQKMDELSGGLGPYDVEFPLTVITQRAGMPTIRDALKKCRLLGGEKTASAGPDPLLITVPLFVTAIYWNGVKPFADMPF